MTSVLNKRVFIASVISFFSSLVLVLIPWSEYRFAEYIDRKNYEYYIDYSLNKIYWFDYETFISKLSFEWLWHKLLAFSTDYLHLDSATILPLISFFILSLSIFIVSKNHKYISFIFLINPVFIDFCFSQMRLAFAMSLLYTAYLLKDKSKILFAPLILAAPFIHTSSVIFIAIFFTALFLANSKRIHIWIKNSLAIFLGLIIAIVTGPLMSQILGSIGDRRAEYEDMSSPVAYMSFWVLFYVYIVAKAYFERIDRNVFFYVSLIILTMIFLNVFISGYSSRFLAAFYPFIILSMLQLNSKEKPIVILGYIAYTFMLWFFWFT